MAGIYDVHTHLNDDLYEESKIQPADIINQSKKLGVDLMNVVGVDVRSSKIAIRQATQSKHIYAVVGIHPNEADRVNHKALETIAEIANSKTVIAIGEIGLDYAVTSKNKAAQKELFEEQLKIAKELNLPVMVHLRDKNNGIHAYKDAYKILSQNKGLKVMIHGYEGKEEYAEKFLELGCFLSFNGKITYGSKTLEKVVKETSLNKILIESDSPYFAPIPYQKEMNYPRNTNIIAEKIAQLKKLDVDEIISATRTNGQAFFNIDAN